MHIVLILSRRVWGQVIIEFQKDFSFNYFNSLYKSSIIY
jgi:hypothetical protein